MPNSELLICGFEQLERAGKLTKFHEEIKDEVISFIDKDGTLTSFSSVCPHLAGEIVRDETGALRCKWHGLRFDKDGNATNCRAKLSLRKYETTVRDKAVYLKYEP